MKIILTKDELNKCLNFSVDSSKTQQEIEFGQKDTEPRSQKEIARDNLIGKIAEEAFAKMLKDVYKIIVSLDYNCYIRGKWDDQDVELNGWRIDVKGTKIGGKWMLIELSKLKFRKKQKLLAHFYVMTSVGWNREIDEPTGEVELVGYASLGQLKDNYPNTFLLRKGDTLPGTDTILQADNYGRKFSNLEKNWDSLVKYLIDKEAIDTTGYDGV